LLLIGRAAIAPPSVRVDRTAKSMSFIFSASSGRVLSAMLFALLILINLGARTSPGRKSSRRREVGNNAAILLALPRQPRYRHRT
jgi:hypothetical protein